MSWWQWLIVFVAAYLLFNLGDLISAWADRIREDKEKD